MDPVLSAEEEEVFKIEGFHMIKPFMPWLRLRHMLQGCTKQPLWQIDVRSKRAVKVGRICVVCKREFPLRG